MESKINKSNKTDDKITLEKKLVDGIITLNKMTAHCLKWFNDPEKIISKHILHEKFDLVISTVDFPKDVKVNVVNGVPFITGIGEEEVIKKIFEILEQKGGND